MEDMLSRMEDMLSRMEDMLNMMDDMLIRRCSAGMRGLGISMESHSELSISHLS